MYFVRKHSQQLLASPARELFQRGCFLWVLFRPVKGREREKNIPYSAA